jgi:hypothetical protein
VSEFHVTTVFHQHEKCLTVLRLDQYIGPITDMDLDARRNFIRNWREKNFLSAESSFAPCVFDVVLSAAEKQMGRIHAMPNVASVTNDLACWISRSRKTVC